jgi:hypothetical protein
VVEFVNLKRQEVIEEERWQETYMQEVFERRPHLRDVYSQMIAQTNSPAEIIE